jgi:hypothetical protein
MSIIRSFKLHITKISSSYFLKLLSFLQEAELLEKYSGQVTVKEILEMYDNDPESFFMDTTRKVSFLRVN